MPEKPQISPRTLAEKLFFEGARQMAAELPAEAERLFRGALAAAPDLAEAWVNLGLVLEQREQDGEAEACYRRALALRPEIAETHVNLGGLLARHKRLDEAEAAYAQALRLAPDQPGTWSNLGVLYASMRLDDEAEACFEKALALAPDLPRARFNLGVMRLRQGRLEEGWAGLEARDWYAGLKKQLRCPRWQGEPLAGRSVLVGYEVGHGDMVQFGRYAAQLKARGAGPVSLLCHPALKRLFATLAGVDHVLGFDEPWPEAQWDVWTPLMSLPYYFETRLDTIPASLPYLKTDPALALRWAAELPPRPSLRVGLVWKGNPRFENDADRSLASLAVLAPLWQVPRVCFVSLQKGAGEDQAENPPPGQPLLHLGGRMRDFADAAAIMAGLDLVIAVDTAMAHLAGALGKPCWLLLPRYQTDWRWLEERTDSPWYPGVMRLFRQTGPGDWQPVMEELTAALQTLVNAAD
ncbi:hypothetical protein RD110_26470 [Rhodoferax koreense]|uniref:Uncharacterized protein n=1 Tax=Rhodoferax koreensis TaxID=1842727 RepID=A0A1P8K2U5_9BURK|nr:tetratricopeptide repeat protein [Rhodoferax koreense]APW40307.1 hypothetical protein RD110_26470 [Rhodoferax koreense]